MKRIVSAALLLCLLCTLLGCSRDDGATTAPSYAPTDTTETAPVVTTEPETPSVTEAALPAGADVTVDGCTLAGGSLLADGTLYVPAEDFFSALDPDAGPLLQDDRIRFTWELLELELISGQLGPTVNGRAYPLEHELLTYQGQIWLPLEEFCAMLEISVLDDPQRSAVYCTSRIQSLQIPQGIPVPILMYHAVSDDLWGYSELFVSPSDLEQQLAYLTENGYDPIFFEDLPDLEEYDKPVILTFDDGYLDNYTELYPLLQKYNVKATIFVITSSMGVHEKSMTREQVKELSDSGLVSIQSHTLTHPELSSLDESQQLAQIRDSKLEVARMTGREPYVLCYPSGERNETTKELTAQYYRFGVDMNGGLYTTGDDPMTISRYYVSRSTSLGEFASMVDAS